MPTASPIRPRLRRPFLAAVAGIGVGALAFVAVDPTPVAHAAAVQETEEASTYRGRTLPSREYDLAFADLGKVAEVSIKQGDRVEEGQALMRQDERVEQARLEQLRIEADVSGRVELAQKRLELAETRFEQAEILYDAESGNSYELDEARLEKEAASIQIGEEERQGLAAAAQVTQLETVLEQKVLASPGSGIVQEVEAQIGEVFGPQQVAVKIVTIDPVDVEVRSIPAREVARLRVGDPVLVRYADEEQWREATVKFIDPVASGDSLDNRRIRLSLPNPEGDKSAGLTVEVRLPIGGS